jgi:pimeloyl-ACP methyl ester carboxylesterase
MKGEIVRIVTSDGLYLDGMLCEPPKNDRGIVLVHCHGFGGSFYSQPFVDHISADVTARGYAFLSINTRGQSNLTVLFKDTPEGRGEATYGAAIEQFEESPLDLAAWIDFVEARGYASVALQGHSMGSIKVAHYQAKTQDARVKTVLLLSPPDIRGQRRAAPEALQAEHETIAERLVAEGRGNDLMPPRFFPYPIGARAFLSIARPESKAAVYNFHDPRDPFETLGALQQPVLGVIGTLNEPVVNDPEECMALLEAKTVNAPYCQTAVIQGADHNYGEREHLLAAAIGDWLDRVFSSS